MADGQLVGTDHLLGIWEAAGFLTWLVQVVPLFVFVSAAVSAEGVARRLELGEQKTWWASRALGLARPTVTYLAVLVALATVSVLSGGRLLGVFNQSLTVHLWFLLMLLTVQALLPWCLQLDRRFGLGAVLGTGWSWRQCSTRCVAAWRRSDDVRWLGRRVRTQSARDRMAQHAGGRLIRSSSASRENAGRFVA